jgi:hypothetical protein
MNINDVLPAHYPKMHHLPYIYQKYIIYCDRGKCKLRWGFSFSLLFYFMYIPLLMVQHFNQAVNLALYQVCNQLRGRLCNHLENHPVSLRAVRVVSRQEYLV